MSKRSGEWRLSDLGALVDVLFARASVGIAFQDCELRYAYASPTYAAAGGHAPAAYVGRTPEEMLPEHAATIRPYLEQVLATGDAVLGVRFGTSERAWLASFHPVRLPHGALLGVGTVTYDDTERQRAEERLAESERRYRALVETNPDAIVITEGDRIVLVNEAALRMIGATDPSQVVGRTQWDFVHPDDLARAHTQYAEALAAGRYTPYEGRFRRLDGTEFVGAIAAALYSHAGGTGVQSVLRDVTAHKARERERERLIAELRLERGLLHTILRQLPAGVVVIGPDGRLMLANEEAERLWGAPIVGRDVPFERWVQGLRYADGTPIPVSDLLITRAFADGTSATDMGLELLCADGVARAMRGNVGPVLASDGARLGSVATFWDVTELTRTQAELRRAHAALQQRVAERTASLREANERLGHEVAERIQAQRQLERAERLASIGTFAAGICHEINNPLAAIVAAAEMARALVVDGGGRDDLEAALARIIAETHRAGRIVRRVLHFAREDQPERSPIDLNVATARVCSFLTSYVLPPSCTLRTRLATRLPPVLVNPTELEQIVLNLVHNAAQASARDVLVETSGGDGTVRLAISDDGHGIAPEHLERIYDPFFTTRQSEGGTGLGLSIVHGLVTACRGTIAVESRPGAGTRFLIDFPAEVPREPDGEVRGA